MESGVSDNQLQIFSKHLRQDVAIEPYLKETISARHKRFTDVFEVSEDPFLIVYCKSVLQFAQEVLKERSTTFSDVILRLSVDEGRSFLKLSGSFVFKNKERESHFFKSSGVKRVLILAIAAVKESYSTIKAMMEKIQLGNLPNELEVVYAQDLKCFNLMLGLGAHRSAYPCLYCLWPNAK